MPTSTPSAAWPGSRFGPTAAQTAYAPNADNCRACGMCVVACPEHAIQLTPISLG